MKSSQYTQSFLDGLAGLPVADAEAKAKASGLQPKVIAEVAVAVTGIARPNTVILWQENGKVRTAQFGDPTQMAK